MWVFLWKLGHGGKVSVQQAHCIPVPPSSFIELLFFLENKIKSIIQRLLQGKGRGVNKRVNRIWRKGSRKKKMVRVATYFAMTLGAFVFWQTMDKVHVWIALHQDEKVVTLLLQPPFIFFPLSLSLKTQTLELISCNLICFSKRGWRRKLRSEGSEKSYWGSSRPITMILLLELNPFLLFFQ